MPVLAANTPGRVLGVAAVGALLAPVVRPVVLGRPAMGKVLAQARTGTLLARGPAPPSSGGGGGVVVGDVYATATPGVLWFQTGLTANPNDVLPIVVTP